MEDSIGDIKLNLGAGKIRWEGWLNVDLEQGDIRCDLRRLDLPADYADVAAAIHVIEHFYEWEAVDVLKEWLRVLKPGGKLILELPCMDKVLDYIHRSVINKTPLSPALSWFVFWGDPRYKEPLMTHKWGYTMNMMQAALEAAGFVDVVHLEARYHFPVRDMRLEALKPCS